MFEVQFKNGEGVTVLTNYGGRSWALCWSTTSVIACTKNTRLTPPPSRPCKTQGLGCSTFHKALIPSCKGHSHSGPAQWSQRPHVFPLQNRHLSIPSSWNAFWHNPSHHSRFNSKCLRKNARTFSLVTCVLRYSAWSYFVSFLTTAWESMTISKKSLYKTLRGCLLQKIYLQLLTSAMTPPYPSSLPCLSPNIIPPQYPLLSEITDW